MAKSLEQVLVVSQSRQFEEFSLRQSQQLDTLRIQQSQQLQEMRLEHLQFNEKQSREMQALRAELVQQYANLSSSVGQASTDSTVQIQKRIDACQTVTFPAELRPAAVLSLWTSFRSALGAAPRTVQQAFGQLEVRGDGFREAHVQLSMSFLVRWLCQASPSQVACNLVFRDTHDRLGPVCPHRRPDLSLVLPGTPSAQDECSVSWVHMVTIGELKQQLSGHSATVQAHDYAVFMMRRQTGRQFATSFTSDGRTISFWKFGCDGSVACFGDAEFLLWTAGTSDEVVPEGFVKLAGFLLAPLECHGFCRVQEVQLPVEVRLRYFDAPPILERAASDTRPAVFSFEV